MEFTGAWAAFEKWRVLEPPKAKEGRESSAFWGSGGEGWRAREVRTAAAEAVGAMLACAARSMSLARFVEVVGSPGGLPAVVERACCMGMPVEVRVEEGWCGRGMVGTTGCHTEPESAVGVGKVEKRT